MARPRLEISSGLLKELVTLYEKKSYTLKEVASCCGLDHRTVRRILQDAGVKIRPRYNQ